MRKLANNSQTKLKAIYEIYEKNFKERNIKA